MTARLALVPPPIPELVYGSHRFRSIGRNLKLAEEMPHLRFEPTVKRDGDIVL